MTALPLPTPAPRPAEPRCGPGCTLADWRQCKQRNKASRLTQQYLPLPCLEQSVPRTARPIRPGSAQDRILAYLRARPGQWVGGRELEAALALGRGTRVDAGGQLRRRGLVETDGHRGYRVVSEGR